MNDEATPPPPAPEEYAIVEVFGHRRHAGRVLEIERFGTKLLRIDIPTPDAAAGEGNPFGSASGGGDYESHYYGGGAIFSLTPTTLEVVKRMNAPYRPALPYTSAAAERDRVIEGDEPDSADEDAGML